MALSAQQIENRRHYIGGSDARTVLEGDGEAWTALRARKVDGIRPVFPEKQQLLMDMGSALEPLCLRELNKRLPLMKIRGELTVKWPDDPFLAFTPDGITAQDRLPVQCKFHSGDQNILELAETYKAQLTHEMICIGTTRSWFAVLFGHYGRFQHMEVKRDEALVDQYLMRAMEFKQFFRTGILPETMAIEVKPMAVDRKRDHVWKPGDNEVAPLCQAIIDNMAQHGLFDQAMDDMKKIIKRQEYADCGSLVWRNEEGYGVLFKLDARSAVRYSLAFPPRTKKAKAAAARQV